MFILILLKLLFKIDNMYIHCTTGGKERRATWINTGIMSINRIYQKRLQQVFESRAMSAQSIPKLSWKTTPQRHHSWCPVFTNHPAIQWWWLQTNMKNNENIICYVYRLCILFSITLVTVITALWGRLYWFSCTGVQVGSHRVYMTGARTCHLRLGYESSCHRSR